MRKSFLIAALLLAVLPWHSAESATTAGDEQTNSSAAEFVRSSTQIDFMPVVPSLFDPQNVVQVGVECVAVPQCPDCTRGGNVCRGVQEFYPGLLGAAVAKKSIIAKCQKANALDYCGGSIGCMKLSLPDQKKYRNNHSGGCYPQCPSVAKCVVMYKNP